MRHLLLLAAIVTEWGRLTCSAIDCAHVPDTGLRVYRFAPALAVTRNDVPILKRISDPCRRGRTLGTAGAVAAVRYGRAGGPRLVDTHRNR